MKNRNKKGQFARNETKNIVAVMVTVFIVISIAFFAKEQAIRHNMVLVEQAKAETHKVPDKYCITTGEGTGNIISICADTEVNLLKAIQTDWNEPEAPKMPAKSGYTRRADNPVIMGLIRTEAQKQGYSDIELALDLADCESRFNPKATGVNKDGTRDRGVFQINEYWHKNISDTCAYDASCNIEYAIKLLNQGKAHLWSCYRKVR